MKSSKHAPNYARILASVVELLESARRASVRAVNVFMTGTYWEIGKRIVENEQQGAHRAGYGEALLQTLSKDLTTRFDKGFSSRNLALMRLFYLSRPILQTPSAKSSRPSSPRISQTPSAKSLTLIPANILQTPSAKSRPSFPLPWSHYVRLLSVKDEQARIFYETEALRGGWSVKQLDRQISTLFYERTALSRNKAVVLDRPAKRANTSAVLHDIKEPFILEFLGLKDEYSESDLESSLLNHLQSFLLELGDDFAFAGRQRRLRVGHRWYRIDLLFFHRRLRCLVVIDLKLGPLSHEDAGQMLMYLNFAREHWLRPGERPPVGLILCSEKDEAVARYTLGNIPTKILAAEYKMKLPKEDVLIEEISRTRDALETRSIAALRRQ